MHSEVTIKRIEVLTVSPEGIADIAVHLDGIPNDNFRRWFSDPTGHNYITGFDTHSCRVENNRILYAIDSLNSPAVKLSVKLIREYVAKANEYARAIENEKQTGAKRQEELKSESDKSREQLQAEIDKL